MIGAMPDSGLGTWFSRWESAAAQAFRASDAETLGSSVSRGLTLDEIDGIDLGHRPPLRHLRTPRGGGGAVRRDLSNPGSW